eukprot:evm.model.NODE_50181_length_8072_cov_31.917368.3
MPVSTPTTKRSSTPMLIILCLALALFAKTTQAFFLSSTSFQLRSCKSCRVTMSATAVPPAAAPAAAVKPRPRREILINQMIESNGGYMARVKVQNFKDATEHTVITSKELYLETVTLAGKTVEDVPVEDYFKAVFKYILSKGMPLTRTEGMIDAGIFPINYFSVSQLAIFMDDTVEGVAAELR